MDELKINQEAGLLLKFLSERKLTPQEKVTVCKSAAETITVVFVQNAVFEQLAQSFKPIERKTIN
ncbi:MAG: hypothetical protein LLG40_10600 [Deltaproteobacteria bacterium]|nr:hypothetical protein [Deltaproteobacteria bacterium]